VAQLARVGTAEQQAACRARLDELEPPIRYCAYQLDKAGSSGGARATEPNSPVTAGLQVCAAVTCIIKSSMGTSARHWQGNCGTRLLSDMQER